MWERLSNWIRDNLHENALCRFDLAHFIVIIYTSLQMDWSDRAFTIQISQKCSQWNTIIIKLVWAEISHILQLPKASIQTLMLHIGVHQTWYIPLSFYNSLQFVSLSFYSGFSQWMESSHTHTLSMHEDSRTYFPGSDLFKSKDALKLCNCLGTKTTSIEVSFGCSRACSSFHKCYL